MFSFSWPYQTSRLEVLGAILLHEPLLTKGLQSGCDNSFETNPRFPNGVRMDYPSKPLSTWHDCLSSLDFNLERKWPTLFWPNNASGLKIPLGRAAMNSRTELSTVTP